MTATPAPVSPPIDEHADLLLPVLKQTEKVLKAFGQVLRNPVKHRAMRAANPKLEEALSSLCELWGEVEDQIEED